METLLLGGALFVGFAAGAIVADIRSSGRIAQLKIANGRWESLVTRLRIRIREEREIVWKLRELVARVSFTPELARHLRAGTDLTEAIDE